MTLRIALPGLAIFLSTALPLHAQLSWSGRAAAERHHDDVTLMLVGALLEPAGYGWTTAAGLTAAHLDFNVGSSVTVTPSIGITRRHAGGMFRLAAGYSLATADETDVTPPVAAEAGHRGVVNVAEMEFRGSGPWSAQFVASYNYGGEALWARGLLTHRLARLRAAKSISAGADAAFVDSESGTSAQLGGAVAFSVSSKLGLLGSFGRKFLDDAEGNYFRVELLIH